MFNRKLLVVLLAASLGTMTGGVLRAASEDMPPLGCRQINENEWDCDGRTCIMVNGQWVCSNL
jgi:hypothetical protein